MKIICVILIFFVMILGSCNTSIATKEFVSPDKNLAVEFTEIVKPGFDYIVGAKIKKNGALILDDPNFAVREADDGRHFDFVFFKTEWVQPNVLQCSDGRAVSKDSEIEYTIINNSKTTIKYLWVGNYSEESLIFGLDPKSSIIVSSKADWNSLNGIYVKRILFDSGNKIGRKDMGYTHLPGKTPVKISITNSDVEFQIGALNQSKKS